MKSSPYAIHAYTNYLQHAELAGEISSMKRELDDLKKDHEEYKGITKKYTDQLVKVKV